MGQKFSRRKTKNILNSLIYRFAKLPWATNFVKFRFFSNLNWIFWRLSYEYSFRLIVHKNHPARKPTIEFLRNRISKEDELADIGCGMGADAYQLSEISKSVVGIDCDLAKINQARISYKRQNLEFVAEDAVSVIRKRARNYDVMICSHVLEHFDDPIGFLVSFKNYFDKIYVEVPDFDSACLNQVRKELGAGINYTDDDHIYEFSRNEIEEIFTLSGLNVLDCEFRYGVMRYWLEKK